MTTIIEVVSRKQPSTMYSTDARIMNLSGVSASAVIWATMSSMTPTTASMRESSRPPIRITKMMQLIDAASCSVGTSHPRTPRLRATDRQNAPNAPAAPAAEGREQPCVNPAEHQRHQHPDRPHRARGAPALARRHLLLDRGAQAKDSAAPERRPRRGTRQRSGVPE